MRFPLFTRFAIVAAVVLALLIPLSMIRDKVAERRDRAAAVQKNFADETTGAQTLAGPVLALTCEETYFHERTVHQKNGKPLTVREKKQRTCPTELVLPAELALEAVAPVEERHRGIYPIRLYRAKLKLTGAFELPAPPPARGETQRVWRDAFLVLAIGDVRGIREVRSEAHEFAPGTLDTRIKSGLHARLGSYADLKPEDLGFDIALELAGTSRLDIAPLGKQNEIRVSSDWPHPSFVGAYPPDRREVSAARFAATWRVNHLATGGNAFWLEALAGDRLFHSPRLVGVALVEPVNAYSMAYRATEYGFLFILLTFSVFGLVELVWSVRLHPLQYLLTGLALSVFFLLLIALSEHIRFGWAYLAAGTACVAILMLYLGRYAALFAGLYAALFILLQSEDHALLLGSLLVFGMLAAVMLLTRKLDWSELSGRLRKPLAHAA